MDKVIVGMSGGVDSSVAALLLKEQGYEVEAMFMKNWEEDDRDGHCSAHQDLEDASRVCDKLSIPLHTRNFAAEYWDEVFANFISEHKAGRTPNPDVLCNREIKFKTFLDHARELGGQFIATGHYARTERQQESFCLLKGVDHNKDQSYFLYTLGQSQLSQTIFPVGHLPKPEVRELARKHRLPTSEKKDSTGICFIGERDFRTFLARFISPSPGNIVDEHGHKVGEHQGLMFYTIGQRQGLGIGGSRNSTGDPWYVADKRMQDNELVVVQGHDHPALFHKSLLASNLHWVSGQIPIQKGLHAKIRYRQTDQACEIKTLDSGEMQVTFSEAQRAITPGQSIVFYHENLCLGGGIIEYAI